MQRLFDESDISDLVKNSDLNTKLATLVTKPELIPLNQFGRIKK